MPSFVQFGQLLDPWKDLFLKVVICEIRKFSYVNLTFVVDKLYQKFFFVLHSTYTGDTLYQVSFNLDNFLTHGKTYF